MLNRIAFLAVVVACCGCRHIDLHLDQVKGSGKLKSETRTVQSFKAIELSGAIDAVVEVGPAHSLRIETDDNLLALIEANVVNGRLEIGSKKSVQSKHPIRAWITVPSLELVDMGGACSANVKGLKASKFAVDLNGASSIKAVGNVDELMLDLNGASSADCSRLIAKRCVVDVNGASQAKVDATESLSGEANGASGIEYYGSPSVTVETNGASSVAKSAKRPAAE